MPPTSLVVVGAGGHGREVAAIAQAVARQDDGVELLGIVDDGDPEVASVEALGTRILGTTQWLAPRAAKVRYTAGLGYPEPRRSVVARLESSGARAATLVHPTAFLGPDVTLGEGAVLWPRVAVTANVRIGRHTHLNVSSSVSHDAVLGDFVTIGPGARICGAVTVEDGAWVGAGATVIQGVRIGSDAVVGAGAAVVRDIPPGETHVGVPARPVPRRH